MENNPTSKDDLINKLQSLKPEQAKESLLQLYSAYLNPAFGALPKKEIEIEMFQQLQNLGVFSKNPDQYSMLSSLRISRSKARNLLYESKLRQSVNLDDELITLLKEPILIKNDDKVCLEVDNPLLIDHIKHELRALKFITDGSFSPDLVKLSPKAYKTLLNNKFSKISNKELKKALVACGTENEITVKSLLTGVLKKVGKKVADDAGDQVGEFIGDYLGDLFSSNLNKATEFIKDHLGKDKELVTEE